MTDRKGEARRVPPLSPGLIYLIKISGNSQGSGISTEAATPKAHGEPNVQRVTSGAGAEAMPPGATGSAGQWEPLPQGLELGWGHGAGWARAAFCPPGVGEAGPGPPRLPHANRPPPPPPPALIHRPLMRGGGGSSAHAALPGPGTLHRRDSQKFPKNQLLAGARAALSQSHRTAGGGAVRTPWDGAILAPSPAPAGTQPGPPGPPEALLAQVLPGAGFVGRSMANPSSNGDLASPRHPPPPWPGAAVWPNPAHSGPVFVLLPGERGRCHLTERSQPSSSSSPAPPAGRKLTSMASKG